ncbi:hypothetical protein QBC38DRAFT_526631 [Podospora fimiseda]|uniref:Ankyrin repeat protein n=1 Tax=Podospora fimiseda TaxID=252190 RepID=A0AAN6YKQ7_9PEZI|nr:hypothetical protein QBC38DRAFT_526631 [Podospora fimiseda]
MPCDSESGNCNDLATAVLKGDWETTVGLLESNPYLLSEKNLFGQNVLQLATEWVEGLDIILASPSVTYSILNQRDSTSEAPRSPLEYAIAQGNTMAVKSLLKVGATLTILHLHLAKTEVLKPLLLDSGFVFVDEQLLGATPLMMLDFSANPPDNIQTAELLLSHGASPRKRLPSQFIREPCSRGSDDNYPSLHFLALKMGHESYYPVPHQRRRLYSTLAKTVSWGRQDSSSRYMVRLKEPQEVEEIREEEALGLELLEILIVEFTAKFTALGITVEEFLRGYWKQRMEEVQYVEGLIPDNELERQPEFAVYLKIARNRKNNFFDSLWEESVELF